MAAPREALRLLLAAGAACAVLLGLLVATARAELAYSTRFGSEGTGDGQFHRPAGIGVDQTTLDATSGDVYVSDSGNARVEQFDSAGHFLSAWGWGVADGASEFEVCTSACLAGLPGGGLGQFNYPTSVAVDSSNGTSQGDVYVSDYSNVSNSGIVDKFSPSGSLLATIAGPSESVHFPYVGGITVDATGDLWVAGSSTVYEFNRSGALLSQFETYGSDPAVDGAGNLYLLSGSAQKWSASARASGKPITIDPNGGTGLGVDLSTGDLYVDRGTSIDQWDEAGDSLGNFGSGALAEGAQPAYNPDVLLAGAGREGALYVADRGGDDVAVFAPPSLAAPAVQPGSESAQSITAKAATLGARVDANGLDTHVYFEYGPTVAYGSSSSAAPGADIGSNFATMTVSAGISGLNPSTTYHYRAVAVNSLGTTYGQDETFMTLPPLKIDKLFATNVTTTGVDLQAKVNAEGFAAHYRFEYGTTTSYGQSVPAPDGALSAVEGDQGVAVHVANLQPNTKYYFRIVVSDSLITTASSAQSIATYAEPEPVLLPDHRAYEMVSLPDKNGGDVGGHPVEGFFEAAHSAWGRAAASGSAMVYASYTSFGDAHSAAAVNQYLAKRGPAGWTTESLLPPAIHLLPEDFRPGYHLFTSELTAGVLNWGGAPLTPGAPDFDQGEFENLYVRQLDGVPYELVTNAAPPEGHDQVVVVGASADLRHVVFDANVPLVAGAQSGENVYEWYAGSLRLVSVLPGPGEKAAEYPGAGDGEVEEYMQENTVSADGSRVFWTSRNLWGEGSQYLYVRENGTTTVALNASQRTPSLGDGIAKFKGATPDGSKVFFTDTTPLTNAPNDNGGLYEYNFSTDKLTNLSLDGGGPPEVEGMLGAGENGLNVYFVARADLTGNATAGGDNLYLSRDGVIHFIGTLSPEDRSDWNQRIEGRQARVTPDGEHVAFVSQASLTGYDNTDLNTESPDAEVFLYDAAAEHLSCASCNPSGAPPVGSASEPDSEHTGHTARFISDDGRRVFFDSKDTLLPSDTNGQQNVYEYEDGTIHIISSGTSDDISTFSDASTSGNDVFFTTRARLVPEDVDNSEDMYDARVDGGFPTVAAPTPCEGEGCRGSLSAPPAAPVIGTETPGAASEALPAQQLPAKKPSKPASHKPKKKGRRKSGAISKKRGRKSKGHKVGGHPHKASGPGHRRGHKS